MPTLYYSPRACSMASHVALEEAGADFDAVEVDIFSGANRSAAFLAINPRGEVPALTFGDGRVLTESVAILGWIGTAFPHARLLGDDPIDRARTLATCAWLANSVHAAFGRYVQPERFSADETCHLALKARARDAFWSRLLEIDGMLASGPWIMGERFTVADAYALVFYSWGLELELPIEHLERLAELRRRLLGRPAARRALERERSALLAMD